MPTIDESRTGRFPAAAAKRLTGSCLLVLACLGSVSCSGDAADPAELAGLAHETGTKVLIVGIDGATFTVMDPLLAAGRLPNLQRLLDEGAGGVLKSQPPMISPALWTTLLTGKQRDDHGIHDFTRTGFGERVKRGWKKITGREPKPTLVSSSDRDVSALWNWTGIFGRTAGFQGWWASWPAEVVNGWMISDRITRSSWTAWTDGRIVDQFTHPPDLVAELIPLVVDPRDPPLDEIAALVQLTDAEREEMLAAEAPIFAHGPSVFKYAYCTQRSLENIALHMLAKEQPDLMGVFLIANDPVCHTFWHYYEPERFAGVDPRDAARLGKLIPAIYEHNDRYLGELLASVDPGTVVLVVSDHGFEASGIVPEPVSRSEFQELRAEARKSGTVAVGQSGQHHTDGVIIAWGPGIVQPGRIEAQLVDIAPTVLALLGLPVPEDLAGRVLTEIFVPEYLAAYPPVNIPSYEPYVRRQVVAPSAAEDAELTRQLRALGYVD